MPLEDLIQSMVIDVNQAKFQEGDPISVFPEKFELYEHIYGIYRRGDNKAYQGNFIPIWMYSLIPYCRKTIIYIRPTNDKKDFVNYCGVTPKELSNLVLKGDVVPILANHFEEYKNDVFEDFFITLKKEGFELIRAQLYEDLLIASANNVEPYLAFEQGVNILETKYETIIQGLPQNTLDEYSKEVEKGLAPELNKLPHFIAEKVSWQKLCGHPQNVVEIEKGLEHRNPLEAYLNARFWHYIVVPDIYARYGISWLADGEDYEIEDRGIQVGLNSSSKIERIEFDYPTSIEDRKRILEPLSKLIDKYSKDELEKELRKKGLVSSERYYKSISRSYEENTKILQENAESWNDIIKDYVQKEKSKEVARLHLLHGAYCAFYISQLKSFLSGEGLISDDELKGLIDNIAYLFKLPKRREERERYAQTYLGKLTALVKGNEKIRNMPFSVISVSNTVESTL
ncbi:MAG: hypothetical protein JW878_08940 [Methanomicrobia archaeon]|nr:hypothetical protein [Methanomicrobia archaeon]